MSTSPAGRKSRRVKPPTPAFFPSLAGALMGAPPKLKKDPQEGRISFICFEDCTDGYLAKVMVRGTCRELYVPAVDGPALVHKLMQLLDKHGVTNGRPS